MSVLLGITFGLLDAVLICLCYLITKRLHGRKGAGMVFGGLIALILFPSIFVLGSLITEWSGDNSSVKVVGLFAWVLIVSIANVVVGLKALKK